LFRKPLVILKIVPKAGHECTLEKIDQWKGKKSRNSSLISFLKKNFKQAELYIYFPLDLGRQKKSFTHVHKEPI
jgi:hypothetical protein